MASGHFESASAHLGEHALRNLALLCVLVFLSYRIVRYLTGWRSLGRAYALAGCERPAAYPHRDPVFGLDALVATVAAARDKTFLASTAQRFQDLGAYTYYTWVQGRQTVHTAEPDNVRAVLATCSKDYSIAARKALLGRFLGRGIFVSEGEAWAHARARLRPSFAREQVTDLAMLERHVQALLRVLPGGGGGGGGGVVDLQAYFTRFTLDSASEFLFGHSAHTLARPSARDQAFGAAFDFSVGHVSEKARRGPLDRFYRRDPREDAARRICRDYVGGFVDEAVALRAAIQAEEAAVLGDKGEQQPPPRHCFLRELARAIDDREHICDEILSMMGAGRDTTASLLSSTFHVLSRRPDIWRTLRGEIEDLHGEPPTYEQLRALKFVKYILNESKLLKGGGGAYSALFVPANHDTSSSLVSSYIPKQPSRRPRHHPPDRRRAPRHRARLGARGLGRHLLVVGHAPPQGPVRARRPRVSPGALGRASAPPRMGMYVCVCVCVCGCGDSQSLFLFVIYCKKVILANA